MKFINVFRTLTLVALQSLAVAAYAAAPTIVPIPDQTVYVDEPALVELMVSDAETPTNLLSLSLATSNPALIDTNKDVLIRWFADGGPGFLPRWYATVAPTFGRTGTATNTVTVSDGTSSVSASFVLTVVPPPTNAVRVANTNPIALPASGVASQYPSTNVVTGLVGTVTNVVVSFSRLSHQNPNDLHMLLVSPSGQKMVIWSKVGGGGGLGGVPPDHAVTNTTASLTDAAADFAPLPDFYYIWTERFRPADYAAGDPPTNNFPAPAPTGPYVSPTVSNAFHNAFSGLAANGTWSLYIYDDQAPYTGSIAGGWSLTVMTAGPQPPTITDIADQTILTNTSTAVLPFVIGDVDSPIGSLTLSNASSNTLLVPTNNIVFGGSGSNRTVTVTPAAGQSGTATVSVFVSDGTNVASDTFLLNVVTAFPQTLSFTNANGIGLRDTNSALPYPDTINVTGMSGLVSNVTVTLRGFNHTWGADVDALLVGPAGQTLMLMSDCAAGVVNNATFTFSDAAPSAMTAGTLTTSTNRPTNLTDASPLGDTFPSPAPAAPYGTNLAVFNGAAPNGTWSLYIHDDGPDDTGTITNGWSLTITTYAVPNTAPTLSGISNQVTTVNTATAALPFTIGDAETAASNLVVSVFTSSSALAPTNKMVLGGSGANRTLTVTPSSNVLGSATISFTVSDGSLVASNSFLLTVNPAVLIVTGNNTNRTYGAANPAITGGIAGLQTGDTITASFTNPATSSSTLGVYSNTVTLNDPNGKLGIYTVTTNLGTMTITAAPLTVTANNTNKVYGNARTFAGTEFAITSGALFNGNTLTSVTLTSTGTNAAAAVGTYPITAANAVGSGLANYAINYANGTLTVTPAALTVTANSTNKVYGTNCIFAGTEFAITSGALVNGNTLTSVTLASTGAATNAPIGTYAITATNAVGTGLSNYVVGYGSGILTVSAASLMVTAGNTNKVYGATLNPAAYSVSGLLNGDSVTSVTLTSAGGVSNAPVGGYGISASAAQGLGLTNYVVGYSNGTLTVSAGNLLITALGTNKVYGTTLNPTEFAVSGLLSGDSVTNVTLTSAGSVSNAPVGSHAISASSAQGAGLTNYVVGYSNGTLTVSAGNLLITALSTNKVYGTTLNPAGYSVSGLLNGDSVTNVSLTSAGSVSNAPVGSYAISASGAQGAGLTNYVVGYGSGTLTVSAANLLVTAGNTNKVYGATLSPAGYSVSGLLNADSVTNVTLTSAGGVNTATVGGYAINASSASGVGLTNYSIGYSGGTLTVGAASLLVTAANSNKVYGATLNPVNYSVTGLVNSDSVTNVSLASAGSVSSAPVGGYAISASAAQGVGLTNYVVGYNSGTLTVSAANLLVTAGNTNKVYGATLNPTAYSVSGLLNADSVTNVTLTSGGSVSNATLGGYVINASGASGVGLTNYSIGYSNGTLTVGAANLWITAANTNKVYGTTLNPVAYIVTGLVSSDSVTNVGLTSAGSVSNAHVGSYSIMATSVSGVGLVNYSIGYSNGTLTVGAANLSITAANTNKVYGTTINPTDYAATGLLNGDSVTNVTLASAGSASNAPVGSYHILASGATGAGLTNYTIGYSNGTLTVGAWSLLITAGSTNKVYGATVTPVAFVVTGLVNGDAVTNLNLTSAGGPTNASVGNYVITAGGAAGVGLTNYSIGYSNGTLSVTPAVLVATADNKSRAYGQANPAFTISYTGFVNGEGTNVLDVLPVASSSATNASAPSNYIIAVTGGSDDNYTFSRVDGTLTVSGSGPVVITTIEFIGPTSLRLAGSGDANVSYKILASSDLSSWTEIGTAVADGGGAFEFVDAATAGFTMRFYRVALP